MRMAGRPLEFSHLRREADRAWNVLDRVGSRQVRGQQHCLWMRILCHKWLSLVHATIYPIYGLIGRVVHNPRFSRHYL